MTSVSAHRSRLATAIALVLATVVMTVLPVSSATAATDNRRSTLVKYINSVRAQAGDAKLRSNEFLDDYAQAWAAKLAKANGGEGSTVSAASKPLPPVSPGGAAPALINVQCVDKKNAGSGTDNGIRYCLRYDYDFFAAPDSFNYMAIGVVTSSTKTFAVMVMAEYPDGAPRRLTSVTPEITGTGRVGDSLGVRVGTWSPATGVTFSYNWRISGATVSTAPTFTPQPHHRGSSVTVAVTGTRSGYWSPNNPRSSTAKTITAGVITQGTLAVTGDRYPGRTLTAITSGWAPNTLSFSYQWLRNGVAITGATGVSYAQTETDVGAAVNVRVTATAPGYTSRSVTTANATLTNGRPFTTAPVPTISGTAQFGSTLTAVPGSWQPGPVELAYRWNLEGEPIRGAIAPTFSVPASAVGKRVTVTVTATKIGFAPTARVSAPTAAVATLPFTSTTAPTISGSTLAGRTLTAQTAPWSPVATISYRWYRDGVVISGATAATYVTTSLDRGKSISVRAAGRLPGYTTTTVFSTPVLIR